MAREKAEEPKSAGCYCGSDFCAKCGDPVAAGEAMARHRLAEATADRLAHGLDVGSHWCGSPEECPYVKAWIPVLLEAFAKAAGR